MEPERTALTMYTAPVAHEPLAWDWVVGQLEASPTYWVATGHGADPHPRPVWGVWDGADLLLSLGSPALNRAVSHDPRLVVHLESGTDVVILHGDAAPWPEDDAVAAFVERYDAKYDLRYDAATYGPPLRVRPTTVLAWRAAGPAGRDGFATSGRWTFP